MHVGFQLKSFINLAADFQPNEENPLLYMVTCTDLEDREIFQKEFKNLDEALLFANKSYSQWDFIDLSKSDAEKGGCSTCAAH